MSTPEWFTKHAAAPGTLLLIQAMLLSQAPKGVDSARHTPGHPSQGRPARWLPVRGQHTGIMGFLFLAVSSCFVRFVSITVSQIQGKHDMGRHGGTLGKKTHVPG